MDSITTWFRYGLIETVKNNALIEKCSNERYPECCGKKFLI